jgi:hypothetical protein
MADPIGTGMINKLDNLVLPLRIMKGVNAGFRHRHLTFLHERQALV